jgi:hypothetical protein
MEIVHTLCYAHFMLCTIDAVSSPAFAFVYARITSSFPNLARVWPCLSSHSIALSIQTITPTSKPDGHEPRRGRPLRQDRRGPHVR